MLVLDIVEQLPNRTVGWEIGRQLARSGGSIGANIREADGAGTDREFARKMNIARAEAAEVEFWLELCRARELVPDSALVERALHEADEIHRILVTIVRRTQERLRKSP